MLLAERRYINIKQNAKEHFAYNSGRVGGNSSIHVLWTWGTILQPSGKAVQYSFVAHGNEDVMHVMWPKSDAERLPIFNELITTFLSISFPWLELFFESVIDFGRASKILLERDVDGDWSRMDIK